MLDDAYEKMIVIDTHVDTIVRWVDLGDDLRASAGRGFMDLETIRRGNLAGAFFACCVEPEYVAAGKARDRLDKQLGGIREFCARNEDQVGLACSADDILRLRHEGRFAVLPAIEGPQAIGDDLKSLELYRDQSVAYISLAHFNTSAWADSSTDVSRHGGISAVGREAIAEMNRLGIKVDVSHISDKAFWDVLEISEKPVFASHSSARRLVNHPRNLSDEMIRAVAQQGGLVGVTWWPEYISERFNADLERRAESVRQGLAKRGGDRAFESITSATATLLHAAGEDPQRRYNALIDAEIDFPALDELLDHIDHMVSVAGAGSICFGSDHGGVNFALRGLEDCSHMPALAAGLAQRGHTVEDVEAILGGNVVRFWKETTPACTPRVA